MKKLFTLFLMTCMMSFADTATAQSITGWTLNVQRNDETAVDITRSNFSNYDNIGNVTALLLNSMNITTTGTFENVTLWVNMHKEGEDKNEWHDVSATPDGAGNWTFTGPIDLYELAGDDGNWLLKFYVEGISGGTSVKDDDNGAYYLFNFTIASGGSGGGSDWTVKYYAQSTATLDLTWNGTTNRNYVYNGDGIREQYYGENPGEVGSLVINGFTTRFIYNEEAGVNISSVTLQYRINVDGTEGQWNSLTAMNTGWDDIWNEAEQRYDHRLEYTYNGHVDVLSGLTSGHNYVLEYMYQVVTTGGDYKTLRQGSSDMKLAFTVTEQSSEPTYTPTYKGMTVTLTEDGTEYADIDVSGGSLVSNGSASLVLNNFKVTLGGENIEAVRLYWRVYPDEMGGGSSDIQWNSVDATVRNGEVWSDNCNIDLLGSGVNIEIPEGLQSNKAYRFYCYIAPLVSGTWLQSQEWGDLRIDIKTGNLTAVEGVSETVVNKNAPKYSVAGARVGDGYKGIVIQGGKKIMQ